MIVRNADMVDGSVYGCLIIYLSIVNILGMNMFNVSFDVSFNVIKQCTFSL